MAQARWVRLPGRSLMAATASCWLSRDPAASRPQSSHSAKQRGRQPAAVPAPSPWRTGDTTPKHTRWSDVRITAARSSGDFSPREAVTSGSCEYACPNLSRRRLSSVEGVCPAELRAQCLDEPYHQQGGVGERRPDKPSIPGSDLQTSSQTKTSHVSGVWTRHPDATSSYLVALAARRVKGCPNGLHSSWPYRPSRLPTLSRHDELRAQDL